jgi:hypothetical protein
MKLARLVCDGPANESGYVPQGEEPCLANTDHDAILDSR